MLKFGLDSLRALFSAHPMHRGLLNIIRRAKVRTIKARAVVRVRDRHVDRHRPHRHAVFLLQCAMRSTAGRAANGRGWTRDGRIVPGIVPEPDADDDQRECDALAEPQP